MIEVEDLAKTFGTTPAVRGLTFRAEAGEIVGLLGPNGAGKTTTMRMLATLERPDRGRATIAGLDLSREAGGVRRKIGLVAQAGGTRPQATARDELVLQARLHRLAGPGQRAREMIDTFDLAAVADRPSAALSGGQRRRLDLALGLVHRPPVVFLDEPTAGLDPPGRRELWEHVRDLRVRTGTTVLLSTHLLDEADSLCDRVLILDAGRLVAEDSPARLKQQLGREVITLDPGPRTEQARDLVATLPGVRGVRADGAQLRIGCENADGLLTRIVLALHDAGLEPRGLRVERPTLDDVFLARTASRVVSRPAAER